MEFQSTLSKKYSGIMIMIIIACLSIGVSASEKAALNLPLPEIASENDGVMEKQGSDIITVLDNESQKLAVSIPHQVSETDGLLVSAGIITTDGSVDKDLPVKLSSSHPEIIRVPDQITILAGQNTQLFNIHVIYNSDCGNGEDIIITAESHENIAQAAMYVKDHEGTCIGGRVYHDMHLTQRHSPYYVHKSLNIRSTMLIDPGVVIKFSSNTGLFVGDAYGDSNKAIAEGTPELPIVFTSAQDSPAPGDWLGIYFGCHLEKGTTHLKHCIIEYGGQNTGRINGNIHLYMSAPKITHSIISNSLSHGIYIPNENKPVITNNIIRNNKGSVIYVHDPNCLNFIEDNTGTGNSDPCIRLSGSNSIKGNTIFKKNENIPYIIESYINIDSNSMMIIEDGVKLQFETNGGIKVSENAALVAHGKPTSPIVFTSNAKNPASEDWRGIHLEYSAPSCIEHCLIEYGGKNSNGANIYSTNSQKMIIQNNTIRHAATGLYLESVNPETLIQCNQIIDNDTGVRIEYSDFSIHDNNIFNNQSYALYQQTDHTVDATNNYWGSLDGPGQDVNALFGNITYTPFLISESVCESVTLTNYRPFIPEQPVPENEAKKVQLSDQSVILQWIGTDPNLWDSIVYDVYLGEIEQDLTKIAQDISTNSFQTNDLKPGHIYYWQVVSKDLSGLETPGPIWFFITQGDNKPDLIVSQVIQTPETGIVCGAPVTFTATIQNIGDGPFVDAMYVRWFIDYSYLTQFKINTFLLSNDSLNLQYVWKSRIGEKTVRIIVDYNSDIEEANEFNNTFQQSIGFISDNTAPYLSYAYPKQNQVYNNIQYIKLEFKDDYGGTLNMPAIGSSIMVSVGNQRVDGNVNQHDSNAFRFIPASAPLNSGQYVVSCIAVDMAGNTKNEQLTFFVDQFPPKKPIITGGQVFSGKLQASPFENLTNKYCFDIEGYSEESVDCRITKYHPRHHQGYYHFPSFHISGNWSKSICLYEGLSSISVYYKDQAGNDSPYEWIDILYDTVAPEIVSITPTHNSFISTPPENIHIQFKEETSGINMYSSTVQVKTSDQEAIQGVWTITDDSTITYTPTHAFEEKLYFVSITLVDRLNHQSLAQVNEFTVDTTPPSPPDKLDYPSLTPVSQPVVKGIKEAWASICLNGQRIVNHTASMLWEYTLTVQAGPNPFTIFARDRSGNRSENVYFDITYDDTPPTPIDHIIVNHAFDGKTIVIDWSGDDVSGADDIASYDIYLETEFFDDFSPLTIYDTVFGDTSHYTFGHLSRNTIYYIAVIPKDNAGAIPTSFTPVTATPMDMLPPEDVTHLQAEIFKTSVCFSWTPSINSDKDLFAYILLLNNEQESITLSANIHEYTLTHLTLSTAYTLTVIAMDNDQNTSNGKSLTFVTLLAHPKFTVSPHDQNIDIQWLPVDPAKYVSHYAIFVESQFYTSTYQLTPFLITKKQSASLNNLNKYQDYYIAVGTVNISEGMDDAITPVLARPSTEVIDVYANYPSPCQLVDDYQLTIEFSASMDISKAPVIEMISTGKVSPTVYSGGVWKTTRYENDTYVTSDINLFEEMAGDIMVNIVSARDINGYETVVSYKAYTFVLIDTVPAPPMLCLEKLTQASTMVCWEYDVLSNKISWFYMYLSLSPFTDLTAVSPVAISDHTTRCYDFGPLTHEQSYYIAVVPRDAYGIMAKTVFPKEIRISGKISFNQAYYTLSDSPIISYSDTYMNQHSDQIDSMVITLSSDSDPTGITLLLFETHTNSSIFSSESIKPQPTFRFDLSNGLNHVLQVSNGDTIMASSNNLSLLSYQGYAVMDSEPPISVLEMSGLYYVQDNHIYVNPQTTFSIIATDNGSNVDSVRCSMDGGAFYTCPESFCFQTEGFHRLIFQSDDIAGNIETAHQQDIIVDTVPPEPPDGISSSLNGDNATILWKKSPEPDVSKYYVYKNGMEITPKGIFRTYFSDPLIPGRRSTYHITAMDRLNNESQFSVPKILSLPGNPPVIKQPDSGVYLLRPIVKISGISDPGAAIEIQKNTIFYGTTQSNSSGIFHFSSLHLDEGMNYIRAIATTSYGVRSPESSEIMIYFYSNPSVVTGLVAESLDTMINLSWNPTMDQSIVTYRIYRNGIHIGDAMPDQVSFLDKCLTNGKPYQYHITTMNENGMEGPSGDSIMATPEGEWP